MFWNGYIRLFMEVFQELALHSALNIHTLQWDSPFEAVKYSNYLSIIFLSLVCIVPICLTILYCAKTKELKEKEF